MLDMNCPTSDPVVRFTLNSYTVTESEGQLTMTVESSRIMGESITMQVIFKDGTAIGENTGYAWLIPGNIFDTI